MEIKGKTAIVTGAARGIGRGIAAALAREGAEVVEADLGSLARAPSSDWSYALASKDDLEGAVENYVSLINQKIELDAVIEDLRSAVDKTPDVPILWQTLGDALMQSGEISEAIDAYRRGMESV